MGHIVCDTWHLYALIHSIWSQSTKGMGTSCDYAPWQIQERKRSRTNLGNTSVLGATYSLLSRDLRREVAEIANKMTYLELSADNRFMDQFMSALFLPHTDTASFPSVMKLLEKR